MQKSLLVPSAYVLALLGACDTRADPKYAGDSLLHLEGRVVLESDDQEPLIPVLAFATNQGYELVEVDVKGSFPNNFEIEVYSPPPAAARADGSREIGLSPKLQIAKAYIGAVPKEHLSKVLVASYFEEGTSVPVPAACEGAKPACQRVQRWCVDTTKSDCRVVGLPCAEAETCRPTVSEGNAAIVEKASDVLHGISTNIIILWTRDGVPASSILLQEMGLEQDLKAGYNLVELGEPWPDGGEGDIDTDDTCTNCGTNPEPDETDVDPIEAEALARYNAAHGTDYASADEAYDELHPPGVDDYTAVDAFENELSYLELEIRVEQGMDISELRGTRLIENWNTRLVITVGTSDEPLI